MGKFNDCFSCCCKEHSFWKVKHVREMFDIPQFPSQKHEIERHWYLYLFLNSISVFFRGDHMDMRVCVRPIALALGLVNLFV